MHNIALRSPSPDIPRHFHGLWSLWDMLESYFPIYQLALSLATLRTNAEIWKRTSGYNYVSQKPEVSSSKADDFRTLLAQMHEKCTAYGFTSTADLAKRITHRELPQTYAEMIAVLNSLNDSLSHQLESEGIYRIPLERKKYYGHADLLGQKWPKHSHLAREISRALEVATFSDKRMRASII